MRAAFYKLGRKLHGAFAAACCCDGGGGARCFCVARERRPFFFSAKARGNQPIYQRAPAVDWQLAAFIVANVAMAADEQQAIARSQAATCAF